MEKLVELYKTDKQLLKVELNKQMKDISPDEMDAIDFIDRLTDLIYKSMLSYGKKGHIYCLHNEIFNFYGPNVYKLGLTCDLHGRLNGYLTSYPKKPEYKFESAELANCELAEEIMFHILADYRMADNREFFDCRINLIAMTIQYIERMFKGKEEIIYVPKVLTAIEKELTGLLDESLITKLSPEARRAKIKEGILNARDITDEEFAQLAKKYPELIEKCIKTGSCFD